MPIEFRCTQCNRLLRTRDDTAGKQAKCPECGAILTIPTPTPPAGIGAIGPPAGMGAPPAGQGPPSPFGPIAAPSPGPPPQSPFGPAQPSPAGPSPETPFGPIPPPPPGTGSPFGAAAAPDSANPYASPADYTVAAPFAPAVPRGRIVPTQIAVGDVFGRAWDIYKEQWGLCLGIVLVAFLINFCVGVVGEFIPIAGAIASSLFSIWINIGVVMALLKIARGAQTNLGDIFQGGPYFLRVFCASILYGLMVMGVAAILFVPGMGVVYLALRGADEALVILSLIGVGLIASIPATIVSLVFSQFYYLIVDQDAGILDSLRLSRQVMAGNKLVLFLIWFLMGLINLAGFLACCVGLLFTMPLGVLVNVVAYLAMTGQPTAGPAAGRAMRM